MKFTETEVILTEKEIKLINDIWKLWGDFDKEFGLINNEEFANFIIDVVGANSWAILDNKTFTIVRLDSENS